MKKCCFIWICLFCLKIQAQDFRLTLASDQPLPLPEQMVFEIRDSLMIFTQQRLPNILQLNGYFEASVSSPKPLGDNHYAVEVVLGTRVQTIALEPSPSLPNFVDLSTSDSLPVAKLPQRMQQWVQIASENGYPFARFWLDPIARQNHHLKAQLKTQLGEARKIAAVQMISPDPIPKNHLRQLNRLLIGQNANAKSLDKLKKNLEQWPFLETTRNPEWLFTPDSTVLYIYVKRKAQNMVDGLLGFASKTQGGLQFNGRVQLQLSDVLKQGERFSIHYKSELEGQQQFESRLHWPLLGGSPMNLTASFALASRDSSFVRTEQLLQLSWPIGAVHWGLGWAHQNASSLEENNSKTLPSLSRNLLRLSASWEKVFPHFHFMATTQKLEIGVGHGQRHNAGQKEKVSSVAIDATGYWPLAPRWAWTSRIEGRALWAPRVYAHELYWLGGANHLRGFPENQIQAQHYLLLASELRWALASNLYGLAFGDWAKIYDTQTTTNWAGIGLGMGLQTAGGVFRLLYALGQAPQQNFDLNAAQIHLNWIQRF